MTVSVSVNPSLAESANFQSEIMNFSKSNGGFFPMPSMLFRLLDFGVLDAKEFIFLSRLIAELNGKKANNITLAHSKVMRMACCGKEKASAILKKLVNKLKYLRVSSRNKKLGYRYSLNLAALQASLQLYSEYTENRTSESSEIEHVPFENRTGDVRKSNTLCPEKRTQYYIESLILDYYYYIRYLTPHHKTKILLDFIRLENNGFDREAIKFYIDFNKVNLEGIFSIYLLISKQGHQYFKNLNAIQSQLATQSNTNTELVAESVSKPEEKSVSDEELANAWKELQSFLKT